MAYNDKDGSQKGRKKGGLGRNRKKGPCPDGGPGHGGGGGRGGGKNR